MIDLGDIKILSQMIQSISKRIIKRRDSTPELQNNLQQISIAGEDLEQLISLKFLEILKEFEQNLI